MALVIACRGGGSFQRTTDFLKRLLDAFATDYSEFRAVVASFNKLLTEASNLAKKRNDLIHGRLAYSKETRSYELRSKKEWVTSDAQTINQLIVEIFECLQRIDLASVKLIKMVQHRRKSNRQQQ
ncbi:MAG: hypothetical protein ACR2IV_11785 [Bryobacteraceae bacterium]